VAIEPERLRLYRAGELADEFHLLPDSRAIWFDWGESD